MWSVFVTPLGTARFVTRSGNRPDFDRKLMKLGMSQRQAHRYGNAQKGYRAVAGSGILTHTITNKRLAAAGFQNILLLRVSARLQKLLQCLRRVRVHQFPGIGDFDQTNQLRVGVDDGAAPFALRQMEQLVKTMAGKQHRAARGALKAEPADGDGILPERAAQGGDALRFQAGLIGGGEENAVQFRTVCAQALHPQPHGVTAQGEIVENTGNPL